jgi:porin
MAAESQRRSTLLHASNLSALGLIALLTGLCLPAWAQTDDQSDVLQSAAAAPEPPPAPFEGDIWTRKQLLGDPFGARSKLAEHGVSVNLRSSSFFQAVTSGGTDTNDGEFSQVFDYIVNIDGHKLGLWEGLYLNMHATTRSGDDVLKDTGGLTLPNAGNTYPLPGDYDGTEITGYTASQLFFDGRFAVVGGKLHALDTVAGLFPKTFDTANEYWNVNALVTATPWFRFVNLAMWGGGAWTYDLATGLPETGLIVIDSNNQTTSNDISEAFDDGVGGLAFHRFIYEIDDKLGYFMLVAGGSTKKYNSLDEHDILIVPGAGLEDTDEKHPYDVAAYVYQEFWQAEGNPQRNVSVLFGGTVADDNPSFSDWNIFGRVTARGLFDSRPGDRMGFAGWASGISDNLRDDVDKFGIDLRSEIWGLEAFYNVEITPWAHLGGDFQIIQSAFEDDDVAVVPGVRLVIEF